jgi:very-short-patch-repair endonuclease
VIIPPQSPKIAIELDGYSHSNPKSFNRDEFVGALFQKFNIPLIRFNNGNYSVEDIKTKLNSCH